MAGSWAAQLGDQLEHQVDNLLPVEQEPDAAADRVSDLDRDCAERMVSGALDGRRLDGA